MCADNGNELVFIGHTSSRKKLKIDCNVNKAKTLEIVIKTRHRKGLGILLLLIHTICSYVLSLLIPHQQTRRDSDAASVVI